MSAVELEEQGLENAGEMAERIRTFDWGQTAIGSSETWSPALRTLVATLLANRFPMLLWWGPEFVCFYNDAYRPVLGTKHPWGLGLPVRECWSEIWHVLRPLIETPFRGGPSTWMDDICLEINRHGFVEETHFTVAYSPVPDETAASGIGGVLATVVEISEKVVGERRVAALRDLAARSFEARTAEDACSAVTAALAGHARDVPFALLYLLDVEAASPRAILAGSVGVDLSSAGCPAVIDLGNSGPWANACRKALASEDIEVLAPLDRMFDRAPAGPWSDPPTEAVVVPIRSTAGNRFVALLVAGVSPRLRFDEQYRAFFHLAGNQIATTISRARAYDEERRRAEALAELDRAKTAFFSNVSHEFRTPLALMLGPLERVLTAESETLSPGGRSELELIQRNGRRLLKLVNVLLDFSRMEAGRLEAQFEPTDLAGFTAELASLFHSAVELGGLRYTVDCRPLPEPVFVDRDMWEKVVLNLLNNAFKFTHRGAITVTLRPRGERVELVIEDTGIGIPAAELPKLFERFHRVRGAAARSHEGTGIGLALVRELVRMHGGSVTVESVEGVGSTFIVAIPLGSAHLPKEQVRPASPRAALQHGSFLAEETLHWHPEPEAKAAAPAAGEAGGRSNPFVLVADDNADMRGYLSRLLSSECEVEVVGDGEQALAAVRRRRPELVLSDVMMPQLDGLTLVQRLRQDEQTRGIPVILLSARAGEEAKVTGLATGADDYLVKPFSARELMARVQSHLALARVRREGEDRLRALAGHLEQQVGERTAALQEKIGELEAFSYSISHDMRGPLRSMQGFATALLEDYAGKLDPTAADYLQRIDRGARRLDLLIRDVLAYSRIDKGNFEHERIDLRAFLEDMVPTLNLGEARVRLDDPIVPVLAHPALLSQIFSNLFENAAKFHRPRVRPEIRVRSEPRDGKVRVWVEDNGIGIAPEHFSRLFEIFGRVHADSQYTGTGIGLAIVKKAAERLGGRAGVESTVGSGSRFWIDLPAA